MKYCTLLFLGILSCSSHRYYLQDKDDHKKDLWEKIVKDSGQGKISEHPMIVLDGKIYRYDNELKHGKLPLSSAEIYLSNSLPDTVSTKIWQGNNSGVIWVESKEHQKDIENQEYSNVMFLVKGKEIHKSGIDKIDSSKIKSITVIKNIEVIRLFTDRKVEGLIIINF